MSLATRNALSPGTTVGICAAVALTVWGVWKARDKRRSAKLSRIGRSLRQGATGKVLDLRDEMSFREARIRGSHNIPVDSLWDDNRWYELPEQHEPLLVLLPAYPEELHASLAKDVTVRRAAGATTTLVADGDLLAVAHESGLLALGPPREGESTTLFTPSPFLTRAAPVIEPQLGNSRVPLTCIDVGCGAGRDAVWLAKRGWTVTALDCWSQALQKTAKLAERMGVADSVEVVRGKVKNTGEIKMSVEPPVAALDSAGDGEMQDSSGADAAGNGGGGGSVVAGGKARTISQSTPASEHGAYGLVVAIRFLERSAFDTLARLVDPRGGYILLSTFIEEERETLALGSGGASMRRRNSAAGTRGVVFHPRESASTQDNTRNTFGDGGGPAVIATNGLVGAVGECKSDGNGHKPAYNTTRGGGRSASSHASAAGTGGAKATPTARACGVLVEQPGSRDVGGSKHTGRCSRLRVNTSKSTGGGGGGGGGGDTAVDGGRKKKKRGSPAAILEAAVAAATMARWPHDSPKDPKKILRRGELARYFGDRHGFEVLEDSVERLPDGRPVACFLARRLPLVVSSPSNTSNASSTPASPCHDGQQQLQGVDLPTSPPTPASQQQRPPLLHTNNDRRGSPARGFSLHSADVLDEDAVDVVRPDSGRPETWGGLSGVGPGCVRHFTVTRAASLSRRRLTEASGFGGSGDDEEEMGGATTG